MMKSVTHRSISETCMGDLYSLNHNMVVNSHSTHTVGERYHLSARSTGLTNDTEIRIDC
jgi:hypothetical protein